MSHGDRATEGVIAEVLRRAESPRPGSHADGLAERVVDDHGRAAVAECARLIIDCDVTRRQAGAMAFGAEHYLDGLDVGAVVSIYAHRNKCDSGES